MNKNPYAPDFEDLPDTLPIFPLGGALLLPFGYLPLNIFEPRYFAMVDQAMATHRMIGMIQPQPDHPEKIYKIGCAGKITDFSETEDGRYLITLQGLCRFSVVRELDLENGFRRVEPTWDTFRKDLEDQRCLDLDRTRLTSLLQQYFEREGMKCDWQAFNDVADGKLITCLSMACPFEVEEKQALLQAECCSTRAKIFMTMLEMALCGSRENSSRH